jgi:hypothetical protein
MKYLLSILIIAVLASQATIHSRRDPANERDHYGGLR